MSACCGLFQAFLMALFSIYARCFNICIGRFRKAASGQAGHIDNRARHLDIVQFGRAPFRRHHPYPRQRAADQIVIAFSNQGRPCLTIAGFI